MGGADLLLSSGPVVALGWALVHFLWQGCLIAALYWLLCILAPRDAAHLRYWSGVGALLLALVVFISTFALYQEPEATFQWAAAEPEPVNGFLVMSGTLPDVAELLRHGVERSLPLIVLLWLSGFVLQSGRTLADWLHVRRIARHGISEVAESVDAAARRVGARLGLRRVVRVLQSSRVTVPMAVGWLRPVVLVPAGVLARLPAEQLEMVLAHELGHIRRYDHIVNWLQIGIETLLYYHPAIGWVSRRVREEREHCCDDLVVSRCRKPATYARALANLEVLRSPEHGHAMMAATGGNLLARIRRIIDSELPRSSTGLAQVSVMALLAGVVALGTHQGASLSRALNDVARVAHLQPSDIEWKTWGRSRAVWGEGLRRYREVREVAVAPDPVLQLPQFVARDAADAVAADDIGSVPSAAPPATIVTASVPDDPPPAAPQPSNLPAALEWPDRGLGEVILAAATLLEIPPPDAEALPAADRSRDSSPPARLPRPVALETVEPRYPWRAKVNDLEGFVELAFSVDEDGRVGDIEVVDAIPSGIFERAAKRALRKWKFAPPAEVAEPVRMTHTFDFELENLPPQPPRRRHCAVTGRRTCSQAPSGVVVVYVNPPEASGTDYAGGRLD